MRRYEFCTILYFTYSFYPSYLLVGNYLILVHITNIVFLKNTTIQLLFSQVEHIVLITLCITHYQSISLLYRYLQSWIQALY